MDSPLLDIQNLAVDFRTDEGVLRAVDGVSFRVNKGSVVGVVGESGCGKSVTSLAIMRLIPEPPGKIARGEIRFDEQPLLALSNKAMRRLRGNRMAMIFQEPMTSLNPVYTVGQQIVEGIRVHQRMTRKDAYKKAVRLLGLVGIPSPSERVHSYPHELSGGMRQRVMIAMALSCDPELLIADEPTTALDVTIQAQILELLKKLQAERGMSILLVTHDLGVVSEFADEIVVMYAGKVVEHALSRDLFKNPSHPYTQGLLRSVPGYKDNTKAKRLPTIAGVVPDLRDLPKGCRFQDRCSRVIDRCREKEPDLLSIEEHHEVACFVAQAEQIS
ncbi:MAG: ABC transporter ATP-binding protein [Myxococcales bacterium]|nr:MAG: ABC transporter ATP-binding protein [Myxococcales bacterium]